MYMTKKKKIAIISISVVAVLAILLYVLFFVVEFPQLAHEKGGCNGEDGAVLCTEPCKTQTLYTIFMEGC